MQNLNLFLGLEVNVKAVDLERGLHSPAARFVVQEVEYTLPESTAYLWNQKIK